MDIQTTRLELKTSVVILKEEILNPSFTIEEAKKKIEKVANQLIVKYRAKVINHFVGSYHDYKRYLNEKNLCN